MPLGISFLTNMAQPHVKQADRLMYKYRIIFKDGDDIRQDQLVLQVQDHAECLGCRLLMEGKNYVNM